MGRVKQIKLKKSRKGAGKGVTQAERKTQASKRRERARKLHNELKKQLKKMRRKKVKGKEDEESIKPEEVKVVEDDEELIKLKLKKRQQRLNKKINKKKRAIKPAKAKAVKKVESIELNGEATNKELKISVDFPAAVAKMEDADEQKKKKSALKARAAKVNKLTARIKALDEAKADPKDVVSKPKKKRAKKTRTKPIAPKGLGTPL